MKRHFQCKFSIDEEQIIIKEYLSGLSSISLCKKYNVNCLTILNILKYYNIKIRSISETLKGTSRARKYSINNNFFEIIDSEDKSYLLGLMFSDGWVSTNNVIGFTSKDKELVELFGSCINSTYPIIERVYPNSKNLGYELRITSEKMFNDLNRHGCIRNKSHILQFPPNIPDNLINHFIRGVFDGDGCIRKDKKNNLRFDICGAKDLLNSINSILSKQCSITLTPISSHSSIFRIRHSGNKKCKLIKEYLYKNATLYLKRKYEKWK